jgi:outer membrane biosynthesis protein TonB
MSLPEINPSKLQRAVAAAEANRTYSTFEDLCYGVVSGNWAQEEELDAKTISQLILHHNTITKTPKPVVKVTAKTPPPEVKKPEATPPEPPPTPKTKGKGKKPEPVVKAEPAAAKPEPVAVEPVVKAEPAAPKPEPVAQKPVVVKVEPVSAKDNPGLQLCKCGHAQIYHAFVSGSHVTHDPRGACRYPEVDHSECKCECFEAAK